MNSTDYSEAEWRLINEGYDPCQAIEIAGFNEGWDKAGEEIFVNVNEALDEAILSELINSDNSSESLLFGVDAKTALIIGGGLLAAVGIGWGINKLLKKKDKNISGCLKEFAKDFWG